MSDVEEWRRETDKRSLYKYLYKPLFVTLIVNKKENTCVYYECVSRYTELPLRLILRDATEARYRSLSLPPFFIFFISVRFLSFKHLRSGLRDEFYTRLPSAALYNFYVAIITISVIDRRRLQKYKNIRI